MLQTQLRYIQTVLPFGIFITLFLNNSNLTVACFVGLALAWQLELLLCELRTDNNEFIFILLLLLTSFMPVLTSFLEINDIKSMIFLVSILVGILYLVFNEISISTFGSSYLVTVISFYIISFCVSKEFIENLDYLTFLFLMLFFIKTLATFLNIQFSNYQYFFNFFASFFVITTISLFLGFNFQYILITAGLVSIFTTILNFLFQRNRREYKYFSELTTQIYLYDYLIAFLFSLYFVDVLNMINGLF